MKLSLVVLLLSISAAAFSGEVYKWKDENGKVHYSDSKPKSDATESVTTTVTPPKPTQDTVRPEGNIRAKFNASKGRLYSLYKSELKNTPSIAGRLAVQIEIDADGKVVKSHIVKSELKSARLENALLQEIDRIDFGKGAFRHTISIHTFDFLPL
ncbi:MAG TPA: DUF4124 domain-containing protein [Cellvibrio sp.]|nr:DUF4124 domain-containing protein [Cellvibrio sp.]